MPYVQIWVHVVWSTKNREPFLTDNVRPKIFDHIRTNCREKKIFLDSIGGYLDHVHALISLGKDQELEDVMQSIKGEPSHWVNQNQLCKTHFGWQEEYFAVSVSEDRTDSVRQYISNQVEHHRKRSFAEEWVSFLEKSGFKP